MKFLLGILDRAVLIVAIGGAAAMTGFPGHFEQYVAGRLAQVSTDIEPFQAVANRHFEGSLASLIQHHANNDDPVFRDEAGALTALLDSREQLVRLHGELGGAVYEDAWVIAREADQAMLEDVWAGYRPNVELGVDGVGFALAFGGAIWLLLMLIGRGLRGAARRR